MKRYIRHLIHLFSIVSLLCLPALPVLAATATTRSPVVISEVQTGGLNSQNLEDGRQEFVELYNVLDSSLSLKGFHLEYLSANNDGTNGPTRTLSLLDGTIPAHGFMTVSSQGYLPDADLYFGTATTSSSGFLARSGGHVRLTDSAGSTLDLVGWGSGVQIANWWIADEISPGQSIQRKLPAPGVLDVTTEFLSQRAATPGLAPVEEAPAPACNGLELSEIMPNATGSDSGKEFIEIHNISDKTVELQGCALRLGDNGQVFQLPNEQLAANAYRAFYDDVTGITLPNTTAQSVWLLLTDSQQRTTYPDNMPDDQSWALIEGSWLATTTATPNAPNILSVQQIVAPAATTSSPASCEAGKERNPETGRCHNIPSVTVPTPCKEGQERNPDTNRCRTIPTVAKTPAPCKPEQERNPETGRCRAVQAAATGPKPCPAGQQRSSETNRCRKSVAGGAAKNFAAVKDVQSASIISDYRWWLAGLVLCFVMGYALYEWRPEVRQRVMALRSRVMSLKSKDVPFLRGRSGKTRPGTL